MPRLSPVPDFECFVQAWAELSEVGAMPSGGADRVEGTVANGEARDWMKAWLESRDFDVRVDPIGNVFGVLTWSPGAPYVLAGSHLDSQPTAGRFDGAYGVVAAMVAADSIRKRVAASEEAPPYNLAVVSWTNEEGARFQPSLLGSSVYAGSLPLEVALGVRDEQGTSVKDALAEMGYLGSDEPPVPAAAVTEIHVEQGHLLENADLNVGVLTHNWAAHKFEVEFIGSQAHTGPTMMAERQDALLAAARVIVKVRDLVEETGPGEHDSRLHTSVGRLQVSPNSPNVVAGRCVAFVELRSLDAELLKRAEQSLVDEMGRISRETNVEISFRKESRRDVRYFDAAGVVVAHDAADAVGQPYVDLGTVAGHDSVAVNAVAPAVMLFTPSADGVAHNEHEFTSEESLLAGLDTYSELIWRLCHKALDDAEAANDSVHDEAPA